MRFPFLTTVVAAVGVAATAQAQLTLDNPVGEWRPFVRDSGVIANAAGVQQVLYDENIHVDAAAWLRVYFGEVELPAGSFVRITSMLDGEVQELDAAGMRAWDHSSAYFNGDTLTVELVAGPRAQRNRVTINEVALEIVPALKEGTCGICGADDRVPSGELWSCRLLPAGCTASVWNEDSCMVSAGHCIGGNMVVQFDVPDSLSNCNIVNPPVADQFPATVVQFSNGGPGNDWSVMQSGTNNLGELPYERYGEFRPIAGTPPVVSQTLDIWGYGVDTQCTRSQTQQHDTGSVTSVAATSFGHDVDATFGNSGSGVIRSGEILGIATHCPCPNTATRVDHPGFTQARQNCEPAVPTPLATGPATDDPWLLVSPDAYGAWAPPFGGGNGPNEDRFNPVGAFISKKAAFTAGTYLFSSGSSRALLTTSGEWLGVGAAGNLTTSVIQDNVPSDTNGDLINDTAVSSFDVSAGLVSLSFGLTQHVELVNLPGPGTTVALLTQDYFIENESASAVDFELVRSFDGDLIWVSDFSNDSVGTGTNASAAERFVYMQEPNDDATAITLSSPGGNAYYGGKHGVDPDGAGGSPAYNYGTDVQIWDAFGVPTGWRNHIAGVGYDTDGDSGASPPGVTAPEDAFIGLEIPVSLGAGETTTVTIHHTWGATEPGIVIPPCPWDCDGSGDGIVSVTDLLALLAEWDTTNPPCDGGGACDYDGNGCVGVDDLLKLLAHYDVTGTGCP